MAKNLMIPGNATINLKLSSFSHLKNTLQIQQLFTVQTCNFFYQLISIRSEMNFHFPLIHNAPFSGYETQNLTT